MISDESRINIFSRCHAGYLVAGNGSTFSEQLVNEKYFMERKLMGKLSDWSMNEKVDGEALQLVDEALQLVDE